ncbi:MAG: type II toxin-antitoxin system MqsA family antitoxin [Rhodocyclales bacterium]|nr:type II toxin-antitoxin system MqsA family antitoxin [Rhodocyclales bacterium]
MKCPICKHGETRPGNASVTLERSGATLVFRDVPADICDNCGEVYHSGEITAALIQQAENAVSVGVEVDVRRFALAA